MHVSGLHAKEPSRMRQSLQLVLLWSGWKADQMRLYRNSLVESSAPDPTPRCYQPRQVVEAHRRDPLYPSASRLGAERLPGLSSYMKTRVGGASLQLRPLGRCCAEGAANWLAERQKNVEQK